MKIMIINGPNLNLLDKQEPDIYGNRSLDELLQKLRHGFIQMEIDYYQSDTEGELVDKLQEVGFSYDGTVPNTGTCTRISIALLDCIRSLTTLAVEVHISNVHTREEFRHRGTTSSAYPGVVAGFGLNSYKLAIEAVAEQLISVQVHKLTS